MSQSLRLRTTSQTLPLNIIEWANVNKLKSRLIVLHASSTVLRKNGGSKTTTLHYDEQRYPEALLRETNYECIVHARPGLRFIFLATLKGSEWSSRRMRPAAVLVSLLPLPSCYPNQLRQTWIF